MVVVKARTAIMVATTAAAIMLLELLPFSSWQTTMMIIAQYEPYADVKDSQFLHQQYMERDSGKHMKHHAISIINNGNVDRVTTPIRSGSPETNLITMVADSISSSNPSSPSKNRLVHSSFRIEEDVIKSLERAAEKRGISMSGLVNKILKNYVTSEMYFEELGFILVSKNFLRKTFDELGVKQIEELGKEYGLTIAREYISYFYPKVTSNTLTQFLDVWFRRFQSCQHRVDNNNDTRHYYTVYHDINMNFSLALQSILEGLIEPIVKSTVEFTNITKTSITFSFEVQL